MLNIPETVKALYKRDGVYKNFRCHFPDGEMSDITNDNIVQESVQFTESICSQDIFKFGLAEASTIEFETVGIGNMYGMTIECSSEIDCSSLSAAEKSDIAAGTWDGTWDSENEVFSVPYGTFRVEECPRDHQAMAHRRVVAYSLLGGEMKMKASENAKLSLLFTGNKKYTGSQGGDRSYVTKTYTPNLKALVYSNFSTRSDAALLNAGYTKASVPISTGSGTVYPTYGKTLTLKTSENADLDVMFTLYSANSALYYADDIQDEIFGVGPIDFDYATMLDNMGEYLSSLGVDAIKSGYSSLADIAKDGFQNLFRPFVAVNWKGGGTRVNYFYAINNPDYGLYLYRNNSYARLCSPTELIIGFPDYSETQHFVTPTASFYEYTPSDSLSAFDSITLSFDSTLKSGKKTSFANAYSVNEIVQGYLEANAKLAKPARNGDITMLTLNSANPAPISPTDYSQMWFDEYDVESIGTIRYAYTDDAGEDQFVDYTFGPGASIYDMSDNIMLKKYLGSSTSTIEAMLYASFIPYLGGVNFTPIDMEMKGLPYIEAGDAITVTAQDGTVCNSYVLRQTQTGVQALRSQVDSQSGLIIDSEEA